MAGGKGGSTTSSVQIPEYIEKAAQRNLNKAERISQIGFAPYYGPDIAGFTPMQEAAMRNVANTAGAFGMDTTTGQSTYGMPAATTYAGGIQGYSSAPLYQQSVDELARQRPAQKSYIDSFFIDPYTGQYGANTAPLIDYTQMTTAAQDARTQADANRANELAIAQAQAGPSTINYDFTSFAANPNLSVQPNDQIFNIAPPEVQIAQQIVATDPTNPNYNDAFKTVYDDQSQQAASDPYGQSTGFGVTTDVLDATGGASAWLPPVEGIYTGPIEDILNPLQASSAITAPASGITDTSTAGTEEDLPGNVISRALNIGAGKKDESSESGYVGSSGDGCVVATHAVNSGAFTPSMKREAVVWCMNVLHNKWWGEAIRRGYRYLGRKKIEQGKAHEYYQEFRDYIAFASGKKRTIKGAIHFAARTAQFFAVGLIKGDA